MTVNRAVDARRGAAGCAGSMTSGSDATAAGAQRVRMHRLRDIFDLLFPDVRESVGEPVADMVANRTRDAHAAGLRQSLQPRGDVDAVAIDVVAIRDDIAKIDPDPEDDPLVFAERCVAVEHRPLDLDCAPHGVHDTRKFDQHAIAGGLDNAAAIFPDFGIDDFAAMRLQPLQGTFLVGSHQPRIPGHIGGDNRREAATGCRIQGLRRSRAPLPDAAFYGYAPVGHSASPASLRRSSSAANNIIP